MRILGGSVTRAGRSDPDPSVNVGPDDGSATPPPGAGDRAGVATGVAVGPWRQTILVAGLIWLVFTTLRWLVLIAARLFSGQTPGAAGWFSFAGAFDAGHFESIAAGGYTDPGDLAPVRQAFFPGYPLTLRVLSELYIGSTDVQGLHLAGFTVTTISSLVATVVVYRLAEERLGRRAGALAALLLMAWPSATFLTIYYSEALYLALATAAWYCGTRGWWWAAGLLCAGASFTRINGVFLALALLVMLLVAAQRGQVRFGWSKLLAVATGFVGAAAYQFYLWRLTGDLFAWSHAQTKGWGRETVSPWRALINTFRHFDQPTTDNYMRVQLAADIVTVAFGWVAMVWMAVRRYWPELTLTVLTFAVLMTSTVYWSVTRNTLTLFPLFVLGGCFLARRPGWVSAVVLSISGGWMLVMTGVVVVGTWAG